MQDTPSLSIPSVGIALWKNQKDNIRCLSSQGALLPVYYSQKKNLKKNLENKLNRLVNDLNLIINMSNKARNTIDGNGATRISREITKLYEKK